MSSFAMNSDLDMYDYKDKEEEEAKANKKEVFQGLKNIMAKTWVDPPKRQRKNNYNESDYFKQTLGTGGGGRKKDHGLIKRVAVADFQFLNRARIKELYDIEEALARYENETREHEETLKKQGKEEEIFEYQDERARGARQRLRQLAPSVAAPRFSGQCPESTSPRRTDQGSGRYRH